jgi:GT2 family glycosyltransferase
MAGELVVSIINYRTGEMTIAAAQSVLDALGARSAKVVIVDNASGDGSDTQIADWIDGAGDARLHLIRSETNSGFSGGHNQTLAACPDAAFYLILNSDALLRPDFFDVLIPAAEAATKAGLIAPQLDWEDGTPQISTFRFASPASELIRAAVTGPVTKLLKRYDVPLSTTPDPARIQWASFACILLRGDMVRALGPMDDGYFLYYEDEEYALRANRAGWGIAHVPAARAVHFRGGSGPVKTLQAAQKRLPNYYYRSRMRFLRQVAGRLGPLRANLCWILGRLIAQARRVTGRGVPAAHEAEWRDIWIGFFDPLKPDPRSPAAGRKT